MRQRITIVVLGLLLGLVARVAVVFYEHHHGSRTPSPPAAVTAPLSIKADRGQ